jgi:hypothetical protein
MQLAIALKKRDLNGQHSPPSQSQQLSMWGWWDVMGLLLTVGFALEVCIRTIACGAFWNLIDAKVSHLDWHFDRQEEGGMGGKGGRWGGGGGGGGGGDEQRSTIWPSTKQRHKLRYTEHPFAYLHTWRGKMDIFCVACDVCFYALRIAVGGSNQCTGTVQWARWCHNDRRWGLVYSFLCCGRLLRLLKVLY